MHFLSAKGVPQNVQTPERQRRDNIPAQPNGLGLGD